MVVEQQKKMNDNATKGVVMMTMMTMVSYCTLQPFEVGLES
jgi:hypothetical protein